MKVLCALFVVALTVGGVATAAENIGKVQQPIIAGILVDNEAQKARGLVTVSDAGGACSGTLINRYWVLTASHCVTSDGQIDGPSNAPGNMSISSAWSATTVVPSDIVRFARGRDVALVFLGTTDFGKAPTQLLNFDGVEPGMTIVKFGRGINTYAKAGPPPVPATGDGLYRMATFTTKPGAANTYAMDANSKGQIGSGGDSGGPDWVVAPGGVFMNIAGVASTCRAKGYVSGMPRVWNWATGISECTSAGISDLYHDILAITRPEDVPLCKTYATQAVATATEFKVEKCTGDGPRWSTVAADHVNWCVAQRGNRAAPDGEQKARTDALAACKTAKLNTQKVPGIRATQFCQTYAAEAVAAANQNVTLKCGGSGGRWTTDSDRHFDWCMTQNGDPTVPNAEAAARADALRQCMAR